MQAQNATQQISKIRPSMKELLASKGDLFDFPKVGDIIEGRVLQKGRNKIYFDLGSLRTGVVYKAEVELSLREAGLDKTWDELRSMKERGDVFPVTIESANRGGLIARVSGVQAFLPVSQLSS